MKVNNLICFLLICCRDMIFLLQTQAYESVSDDIRNAKDI